MTRVAVLQPMRTHRHAHNQALLGMLSRFVELQLYEAVGCSEVARARCIAASRLLRDYYMGKAPPDVVLWLDADIAVPSAETLVEHIRVTLLSQKPVSGRVQMRHSGVVAGYPLTERQIFELEGGWSLMPVRCGMAALAVPWDTFIEHAVTVPQEVGIDGLPTWWVCCPRLEVSTENPESTIMLSEDLDYTRAIGPVYYATGPEELDARIRFLDYGHVDEVVRICEPIPHEMAEWKAGRVALPRPRGVE